MSGGGETRVPSSAASAVRYREALPGRGEIEELFARFCVIGSCADRNRQLDAGAITSRSVAALAMPAALRRVLRVKSKVQQRVVVFARHQDDIAAPAAIPSARSAARNILFSPEGETAVAAITGFHGDDDFIDKHNGTKNRGAAG